MTALQHASSAVASVKASHPVRAYQRYTEARGNVLAGGIAYFAFFSIFPALAIALTLMGFLLRGQTDLQNQIVTGIQTYVPNLINAGRTPATGAQPGIYIDDYLRTSALTLSLVVSLGSLLVTGLGWMEAMRQGIRAVFGEDAGGANFVVAKLRDTATMAVLGVGVAASVLSGVVTSAAGGYLLGLIGADDTTVGKLALTAAGFAVALVFDTLTFLAVFRILPGADVPLRTLLSGAVLGGVGIGLLKQFGTQIAARSADNGFLKAAASIVVLLVLMNLIGRVLLLAAAWAVTNVQDEESGTSPVAPVAPVEPVEKVAPVGKVAPVADVSHDAPMTSPVGTRSADRTTLAAGVILGAMAAGAGVAARRAGRALVGTLGRIRR